MPTVVEITTDIVVPIAAGLLLVVIANIASGIQRRLKSELRSEQVTARETSAQRIRRLTAEWQTPLRC
jgi:hypothetical protein